MRLRRAPRVQAAESGVEEIPAAHHGSRSSTCDLSIVLDVEDLGWKEGRIAALRRDSSGRAA
jgi:hypothetical protein